jgi:hypothetical protein
MIIQNAFTFPITLLIVFYGIEPTLGQKLPELMLILAKSPFFLFHVGNEGNKFKEKYVGSFCAGEAI